jgi:ABC-type multidrug transport system ATPase subunit
MCVKRSEIVGFLGVNGAGKTTSFLLATGLLKPSSGNLQIAGCDPFVSKDWTYSVGVLMGGGGLYPRLTVRRNLAFFSKLYGKSIDIDQHLAVHGLSAYANKPASHLSHGFRRRLALARATLHGPRLLLLDEPADGLDPGATQALHRYLKEYREGGGGVVFTSHRLEEVEQLCDRVVVLSHGRIAVEGTPLELSESVEGGGLREVILRLQAESRVESSPGLTE